MRCFISYELVIYHGSNFAFDKIDLEKSHDRRDFGRGFYCTVLESQAEEAVERLRYNKVNNQVSFHTPLALEHLTLESRREVS